jgi:hypothetical protein
MTSTAMTRVERQAGAVVSASPGGIGGFGANICVNRSCF